MDSLPVSGSGVTNAPGTFGSPTTNIYTYGTLPNGGAPGNTAWTSDRGLCVWNGSAWLVLVTTSLPVTVATPTFSPVAGTYITAQVVAISTTTPAATIYYTTDGSTPTTSSTVYTSPISVPASATLKAIGTAFGFTQSAVATAVYQINAVQNPMGINFAAAGGPFLVIEDFPIFQDMVRNARAFTKSGAIGTAANLDANGWPTEDFCVVVHEGGSVTQSWQTGLFAGGFTGVGTVAVSTAVPGGCTISNIVVTGSGATQTTTFDLQANSTTFAYQVTGTTAGVGCQNDFLYLPAYRSSQSNAGNVNGYSPTSLFTTEAVTFYKQFAWIRDMFWKNAWNDTAFNTSATRRTAANCKTNQFFLANLADGYPLDWMIDFLLAISAAGGSTGIWHCLPARDDGTYLAADIVSLQRLPPGIPIIIEVANEPWNGTGLAGGALRADSVATTPDASFTATISGTTMTVSGVTGTISSGGNQFYVYGAGINPLTVIQSGSGTTWTVSPSQTVGPVAAKQGSYQSMYRYIGFKLHTIAASLRTAFGARFGTDVTLVGASQQGSNGYSFLATMLNYMQAQGYTVNQDVHWLSYAPYINLTSPTLSWTVAQIEANLTSGTGNSVANVIPNCQAEHYSTLAKYFGMKGVLTYEGGWQLNNESNSLTNGGAAAVDSGMTAVESALWANAFNGGTSGITRFDGACMSNGGNLGCVDDLSNNFATLISTGAPRLAAMQTYMPGTYVPTKNVAATGQTFSALGYTDNTGAVYPVFNNFGATPPLYTGAGGTNGAYTYNIYAPVGASLALAVDFTNSSASAANCNVRLDGVQVVTGVGIVPGSGTNGGVNTVTLGTLVLTKGFHELTIGPFAGLATLAITTSPPGLFRWT